MLTAITRRAPVLEVATGRIHPRFYDIEDIRVFSINAFGLVFSTVCIFPCRIKG